MIQSPKPLSQVSLRYICDYLVPGSLPPDTHSSETRPGDRDVLEYLDFTVTEVETTTCLDLRLDLGDGGTNE